MFMDSGNRLLQFDALGANIQQTNLFSITLRNWQTSWALQGREFLNAFPKMTKLEKIVTWARREERDKDARKRSWGNDMQFFSLSCYEMTVSSSVEELSLWGSSVLFDSGVLFGSHRNEVNSPGESCSFFKVRLYRNIWLNYI